MEFPKGPVAIVIGSSRDLGADTARGLAQSGYNILGLYNNPDRDQDNERIIATVQGYKRGMVSVRADITKPDTPNLIYEALWQNFKTKAHALVLNAAGGYDKPIEEAREINVNAQLRLLGRLRDSLEPNSPIVYPTSDGAHRFKVMTEAGFDFEKYHRVAQTKFEAEQSLRNLIPDLATQDLRLAVVVGNVLAGSFIGRVLQGRHKRFVEAWKSHTEGHLPIIMDMAVVVVKVIRNDYPSGHTEYVGITPENQLYKSNAYLSQVSSKRKESELTRWLRNRTALQDIRQEELAISAGLSISTVSKILRGENSPGIRSLSRLSKALALSIDEESELFQIASSLASPRKRRGARITS